LHNAFVSKISPFVNTLTNLGTDGGLIALRMVTTTQIHFENVQGHPSIPKNHKFVDWSHLPDRLTVKFGSGVGTNSSTYRDRVLAAWNFFNPPMGQGFGMIQNLWIGPDAQLWLNGQVNEIVTETKVSAYCREPNIITYTSGNDQSSFYDKHLAYALSMIRSRNGEISMQDKLLIEFEKEGRGGILSSLVGGLITAVAPGSKKVVDTLAGFIPF